MNKLATANTATDHLFTTLYDRLQSKAAEENTALYNAALRRAKTKKQKEACAGYYCGSWQRLFDAWCENKVPNIIVIDALSVDLVPVQYQ